jgi:hypothetical protein
MSHTLPLEAREDCCLLQENVERIHALLHTCVKDHGGPTPPGMTVATRDDVVQRIFGFFDEESLDPAEAIRVLIKCAVEACDYFDQEMKNGKITKGPVQ